MRELRERSAFSFDAFVEEAGVGRGYLSELERGLVVPTIGTLARVARALGVTLADLVVGEGERERLFDELRDEPVEVVCELREALRRKRAAR